MLSNKLLILVLVVIAFCSGCQSKLQTEDFEHFRVSILYVQASFAEEEQYLSAARHTTTVPKAVFQSIRDLRRLALKEANKIDPKALARLDSNMPMHFQKQYVKGLQQWNEGITTEDFALANRGLQLLNEWGEYYIRVLEST